MTETASDKGSLSLEQGINRIRESQYESTVNEELDKHLIMAQLNRKTNK